MIRYYCRTDPLSAPIFIGTASLTNFYINQKLFTSTSDLYLFLSEKEPEIIDEFNQPYSLEEFLTFLK